MTDQPNRDKPPGVEAGTESRAPSGRQSGATGSAVWVIKLMECRLKNRRVRVGRLSNGHYLIHYRNLEGWKNIRETIFRLSPDAAEATIRGIGKITNETWRHFSPPNDQTQTAAKGGSKLQ